MIRINNSEELLEILESISKTQNLILQRLNNLEHKINQITEKPIQINSELDKLSSQLNKLSLGPEPSQASNKFIIAKPRK